MKTLYLDMDGVVADFDSFAEQLIGSRPVNERWPEEDWAKLREFKRMYRDLPKTAGADQLVDHCRKFVRYQELNLLFLTAVPKDNDFHWAFYDKVQWAQQHYPDIPVHFGPYSRDKHVHCTPGDILIDDRTSNCDEWRRAKGVAIQHRGSVDETIQQLRAMYD